MWLATTLGWFSVVCARQNDGKAAAIDPDKMMIRARLRSHLEGLKERFPALLDSTEITESATSDYAFRIFVSKATWVSLATELASDVQYGNFKSAVLKRDGHSAYENALHAVWAVMARLQWAKEDKADELFD